MKMRFRERFKCFLLGIIYIASVYVSYGQCLAAGDFEVTLTTSRIDGVAPLSVFFDATQTPSLADGSYLDATFMWNFDMDDVDPEAKYRQAGGFVAAHVFEHPGTYRVRVEVYDPQGQTAYEETTITVLPFAGQTYYVAQDGSDGNSGETMDDPVQTVSYALLTLALPNTRILLKNGDTFYTRYVGASGRPGPVIIASYEDPADPSDQAPIIYSTGADNDWATIYLGDDWRIMDMRVRTGGCTAGEAGQPRYPGGVSFGGSTNNSLIYRVEQDHMSSQWMDPYGQFNTVAECNIHTVSGTGYAAGGEGGALIGNWVHDKCTQDAEHIFRLQGGSRFFIAFNNFEGNVVNYDSLTIRGDSEKVVIYKNTLDRVTGIWPQVRNSYEEYQHHVLVEANLFVGRDNPPNYTTSSPIRQLALGIHAKDIVIRNNIFYNYGFAISINNDSVVGPSQRIKVYNNTSINMTVESDFYFVNVDPQCTEIEVKNNLILDQVGSTPMYTRIIRDRSSTNTFNGISDHNLLYGSTWPVNIVLFNSYDLAGWRAATGHDINSRMQIPGLASLDLASPDLVRPLAGSPAINNGQWTPAVYDYYGRMRDLTRDIGAVEYFRSTPGMLGPAIYDLLLAD